MDIRRFVVSPIRSNCYVLAESPEAGAKAVMIDPGDTELDAVFGYIDGLGLNVIANWNTHAHFDHVLGANVVRDRYGIPSYVHPADEELWHRAHEAYRSVLRRDVPALRAPDGFFNDGDKLRLGDETFTVWHTPGHSRGSVCFVGQHVVLSGDTLFAGTIGRTDFPESSPDDMEMSLTRILSWDDGLQIYPGHNEATTMAAERRHNPFLERLQHNP